MNPTQHNYAPCLQVVEAGDSSGAATDTAAASSSPVNTKAPARKKSLGFAVDESKQQPERSKGSAGMVSSKRKDAQRSGSSEVLAGAGDVALVHGWRGWVQRSKRLMSW